MFLIMPRGWTVLATTTFTVAVLGIFGYCIGGMLVDVASKESLTIGDLIPFTIVLLMVGFTICFAIAMTFKSFWGMVRFYGIAKRLRRFIARQATDGFARLQGPRFLDGGLSVYDDTRVPFTIRQEEEDGPIVVRIPFFPNRYWIRKDGQTDTFKEYIIHYKDDSFSGYVATLKTTKLSIDEMLATTEEGVPWQKYRTTSLYLRSEWERITREEIAELSAFLKQV